MTLEKIIKSLGILGSFLKQFANNSEKVIVEDNLIISKLNNEFYDNFNTAIIEQYIYNPWFTEEFVRNSIGAISKWLVESKLTEWVNKYPQLINNAKCKNVGVIIAGNIPLVGFHDFLCVLISGNKFIGKLSSKDFYLLPAISEILFKIDKEFTEFIYFEDKQLKNFDMVIATGSNNSSRYFEYYFGKYPHIVRKSRCSAAILTGDETKDELIKLADDIFLYFGLGCRNVSKLYVPENYDFRIFFDAVEKYNYLYKYNKYANNYDYYKSIFLLNKTVHLDNGFLLLQQNEDLFTPVSVINFEFYKDIEILSKKITIFKDFIQCIITKDINFAGKIDFGISQFPELTDYADNIDTIGFLMS